MPSTVTKKDLVEMIAEKTGVGRAQVRDIMQAFLDVVIAELAKGNRLEFRDFGVFESKVRAPRKAQNPKTLAPVLVPARRTVKFKIGRLMREAISVEGGTGGAHQEGAASDGAGHEEAAGRKAKRPRRGQDGRGKGDVQG